MIVRELITKLGFKLDKKELNDFQNAVVGFKTKMSLAAAAVAGSLALAVDRIQQFAQASISVKNIADYAGLATREFVAMREAGKQLGVNLQTFDKLTLSLSKHLSDSRVNSGKLVELWQAFPNKVRLPDFVDQTKDFKNAIEDVANVLASLSLRSDKLQFIQDFFEVDLNQAAEILRLYEQGIDTFSRFVASNQEFGRTFEQNTEGLRKYNDELEKLKNAWTRLDYLLVTQVTPTLTGVLEGVNEALARSEDFGGGFLGFFKSSFAAAGQAIEHILGENLGIESLAKLKERYANENIEFYKRAANAYSTANVNMNASYIFNVPPGTTQEQSTFMFEQVRKSFDSMFDEKVREVLNNNPQVE